MKPEKSHSARIFFALLPDRKTVTEINYHASQFSPGTGRKVSPENYHITLLFLGNVDPKTIDSLCMDCDGLDLPAFELTITTPGWWKRAGILWLAPATVPPALVSLHESLRVIASQRKIVQEKRDYMPHVTLMRKVIEAPQYPVIKPFHWHADSFSLMRSDNHPEGVRYIELASWALEG